MTKTTRRSGPTESGSTHGIPLVATATTVQPNKKPKARKGRLLLIMGGMLFVVFVGLSAWQSVWLRSMDLDATVQLAMQYATPLKEYAENVTASALQQQQQEPATDSVSPEKNDSNTTTTPSETIIHKSTEQLIKSSNTVVTGYFQLRSKFATHKYDEWMQTMLSLQDAMVIFTSPSLVDKMWEMRSHAKNRTVIVSMDLASVPLATDYSEDFWKDQFEKDPEKKRHKDYPLFWIWLSKSWLVTRAIEYNFFDSNIYMWSDIGCFRTKMYRDRLMIQYSELVPRHSVLQMAHHAPNPPPDIYWNDKYHHKDMFFHSGSQAIAYNDTWLVFHDEFMNTIRGFLERDMFIGEDQAVMQSTCMRLPNLCAYVPFSQVKDNHYFGLRHVLYYGGNYTYWRPPGANLTQEVFATHDANETRVERI